MVKDTFEWRQNLTAQPLIPDGTPQNPQKGRGPALGRRDALRRPAGVAAVRKERDLYYNMFSFIYVRFCCWSEKVRI